MNRTLLAVGLLLATLSAPAAPAAHAAAPHAAATPTTVSPDPYLWLEDVSGKRALDWAKEQNQRTDSALTTSKDFADLKSKLLEVLDSEARLPVIGKDGDRYTNLWQDADHPRGLWRRTTLEEYRKADPAWETVLDLDALGAAEHRHWVMSASTTLRPDGDRCLLSLSPGGTDAAAIREFDLVTKEFVPGGFSLPVSKSGAVWIDRDHVFVADATDSSTMTTSGYPRVVKEWTRGTPFSAAKTVFEGRPSDVDVFAIHYALPGFERDLIVEDSTFFTTAVYLREPSGLVRIEKPVDATVDLFRDRLLLRLRSDWTVGDSTYPAGALVASKLDDYLAGKREITVLYRPAPRRSLSSYATTPDAILIEEMDDVKSRAYALRYDDGRFDRVEIPGLPDIGRVRVSPVDPLRCDSIWVNVTGFLTPPTLAVGVLGGGAPDVLKRSPAFFDASKETVSQHEAVSKDGTHVPYFEVDPVGLKHDGSAPVLLTGYGGFELSMLPSYSGLRGRAWLSRGGVYVLANIRGGGEFGPAWHEAALHADRVRAYEDFIAVGEDLVRRGVTRPSRLGIVGGSNGGLLVGNVMTMKPKLFGAVVCSSPLLDMERYTKLSAGQSWVAEYGDPAVPADLPGLRTISPYRNVKAGVTYPPILLTSSTKDDRVNPAHARKMAAKMEAQGHDVLYFENIEGGHAGASVNDGRAYLYALTYEFLWDRLMRGARGAPAPAVAPAP
ncbi:MAG: prolyl oligopeptidase family serine peptidase [Hyphomicrobiales bacterium]